MNLSNTLITILRHRVWQLLIAIVFVLIGGELLAWGAARLLIVKVPLGHADAIVVLSGSAALKERTELAAALYQEGRAPKIILTNDNHQGGWSSAQQRNPFFYERALDSLHSNGVPRENIEVLLRPVASTYDEAALVRSYAEEQGLRSILVVTSAYHSRRALWTMRQVCKGSGIVIGLEPVPPGRQTPPAATWWLHLRGLQTIPGEYLKTVYYRLSY